MSTVYNWIWCSWVAKNNNENKETEIESLKMVETDGIQDVSNETELTVKQRSHVNRHLNGTNGTNGTAKANRDPPKNLVICLLLFSFFVYISPYFQSRICKLIILYLSIFDINRYAFCFSFDRSLNMCSPSHIQYTQPTDASWTFNDLVWKNVAFFVYLHLGSFYGLYQIFTGQCKIATILMGEFSCRLSTILS